MAGRHRQTRVAAPGRHRKPARRGGVVLPSLAVAAVLSLGSVGANAALTGGDDIHRLGRPAPLPTVALVPMPVPTSAAPVNPTTVAARTSPVAAAPSARSSSRFAMTATGRVAWVQVVAAHGKVLYAGLLRHGRTITFGQRPLRVTIGDAGAVRVVLRGHARPAGRRGQVLRFTVR